MYATQNSIRNTHDLLPAFRKCLWAAIVEKKLLQDAEPKQETAAKSIGQNDSISNVYEIKRRDPSSPGSGSLEEGDDADGSRLRARLLQAFPVEAADRHLLRMLSRAELKVEAATRTWIGWVEWRRGRCTFIYFLTTNHR
jgi:hypothetical protein